MKKRRNFFVLALVATILFLGVGYATVSKVTLTISGNTAVEDSNLNVVFTGTPTTNKAQGTSESTTINATSVEDGLTATITVDKLKKVGDKVTATYTIKNKETDIKASVIKKSITVKNGDDDKSTFFEVTTDMDTTAKEIAANGTTTVTVTVELKKLPIEQADSTANITIELEATPVALN